jgi:hypothetical protein
VVSVTAALRRAVRAYHRFFFVTADARLLAGLRIGYALLVLVHWAALFPHLEMLWSEHGVLPLERLTSVAGGFAPTLFYLLPRNDAVVYGAYALACIHAVLLAVGYRTRLQTALVLVWLISFQNRNPLAENGQDALLRLIGAFLLLLPTGRAYSFDARAATGTPAPIPGFALRLLQLQVCFVMLAAGLWKLRGDDWTRGTALYYVTRLQGFWGNLPVPSWFMHSERALATATFATLAVELVVPLAIWVPGLRRGALLVATAFHLSLAYAMNLFLFPWVMLLGWCSFLRPEDFAWVRRIHAALRGSDADSSITLTPPVEP